MTISSLVVLFVSLAAPTESAACKSVRSPYLEKAERMDDRIAVKVIVHPDGSVANYWNFDGLLYARGWTEPFAAGRATTAPWVIREPLPDGRLLANVGGAGAMSLEVWSWSAGDVFTKERAVASLEAAAAFACGVELEVFDDSLTHVSCVGGRLLATSVVPNASLRELRLWSKGQWTATGAFVRIGALGVAVAESRLLLTREDFERAGRVLERLGVPVAQEPDARVFINKCDGDVCWAFDLDRHLLLLLDSRVSKTKWRPSGQVSSDSVELSGGKKAVLVTSQPTACLYYLNAALGAGSH